MKYSEFKAAIMAVNSLKSKLVEHYPTHEFSEQTSIIGVVLATIRDEVILSMALQIEAAILMREFSALIKKEPSNYVECLLNADFTKLENGLMVKMIAKKVATEISDCYGVAHNFTAALRDHAIAEQVIIIGFDLAPIK